MAVLTITEASKTWDVGRATIYRKLNNGELSSVEAPDGGRGVDTSEMLRVFGAAPSADVRADAVKHSGDSARQSADAELRRENEHLRTLLEAKDEHIASLKKALTLLEHKVVPAQPEDTAAIVATVMERTKAETEELRQELERLQADAARAAEAEGELAKAQQKAEALERSLEAERNKGLLARIFRRRKP